MMQPSHEEVIEVKKKLKIMLKTFVREKGDIVKRQTKFIKLSNEAIDEHTKKQDEYMKKIKQSHVHVTNKELDNIEDEIIKFNQQEKIRKNIILTIEKELNEVCQRQKKTLYDFLNMHSQIIEDIHIPDTIEDCNSVVKIQGMFPK